MRKWIFIVATFMSLSRVNAQDVNRTLGFGLQASFPTFGISAKYALTDQSVVQATIAPFGSKSDGGSVSLNFYGLRYIHRFPGNQEGSVVLDPYLFAGGGLLVSTVNMTAYGLGKSTESVFAYSGGGGLEIIVAKKLGLSAEIGYGRMGFSGGVAVNSMLFGSGIHFYIQ